VIPDLNPVLFRSADSSARTNTALTPVFVSGKHITWVLGSERPDSVTTDSGQQVSLQLIPGTLYYGRLMCYGDTQWFTFRTTSQYRRRALFQKLMTFPDTTTVRVWHSDGEGKLTAKADFLPGPDGMVTITVPLLESGETS
jgi:hypothetical protein